jgi:TonB family protein
MGCMLRTFGVCLLIGIAPGLVLAQATGSSVPTPTPNPHTKLMKVYSVGLSTTPPELLAGGPVAEFTGKCKKRDGMVEVGLIVDSAGVARDVAIARTLAPELTDIALQVVGTDHFKPGEHDGVPVAVGMLIDVTMQGCSERSNDESGRKIETVRLRLRPVQKLVTPEAPPAEFNRSSISQSLADSGSPRVLIVGGGVTSPVPLNNVEARYTKEARKARINGICLISLIVDVQGAPQNAKVIRSLDPGLDENALKAVGKYRFKPAMKNGTPVPVSITIEVKFQLLD